MAYYITDKLVIDASLTERGLELISNFINDKMGYKPDIENLDYGTVLVKTFTSSSYKGNQNFSNTVGITNKQIYVNPITDKNRNNYTVELLDYIISLPKIIREEKIKRILYGKE
jgi:type IV secretory pathway component VirB8